MNVIEAIRTRRVVRRYRDPLPADAEPRRGRKGGRRDLDDLVRWERW